MQRYSSAQGNVMGPCPCGAFHHGHNNQSFCPAAHLPYDDDYGAYSNSSFSSSSVDCTLSLGTPSTRRTSAGDNQHGRSSGSRLSNFCWDFLQTNSKQHSAAAKSTSSNHRAAHATHGGDPLLARRCANCDTTSTPLWRNGPRGPKSLCNACGIRFKKEERRASAAAANNGGGAGGVMDGHVAAAAGYNYSGTWGTHQGQKVQYLSPAGNEFRFIDDVVAESGTDSGMQFLSWRLNVTDRPTSQLVYDFTR